MCAERASGGFIQNTISCAALVAAAAASLMLSGCAIGSSAGPETVTSINSLGGTVHGGNNPVAGANVYLYVTNGSGYTAAPTLLAGGPGATISTAAVTTASDGTFNFGPLGIVYTTAGVCPSTTSQVYIAAAGGNPGLPVPNPPLTATNPNPNNAALVLVAALGTCTSVTDNESVQLNEVTTVATAYALQGFATSTFTTSATVNSSGIWTTTLNGGFNTSSTNAQGLVDGFANANNIVPVSTGIANTATASGGVVPNTVINSLGDILQDCVNSNGETNGTVTTSSSCTSLFGYATPPSGTAPTNVLQAAIDIAQNPANNVSPLLGLIDAIPPAFLPNQASAPDLTIGIIYPSSHIASATAMAIDSNDNVYITSPSSGNQVVEFSPQGALLSGTTGWGSSIATGDGLRGMTFDKAGNLWISDSPAVTTTAFIYEYTPAGTATAPTQGTLTAQAYTSVNATSNNYTVAVDQDNDVWTSSYKAGTCTTTPCSLVELVPSANPPTASSSYSPYGTFSGQTATTTGYGGARAIAFDVNQNNIWYTDIVDNKVQLFTVAPVSAGVATAASGYTTITLAGAGETNNPANIKYGTWGVAIDSQSNAWVSLTGGAAVTTGGATKTTNAVSPAIYAYTKTGAAAVTPGSTTVVLTGNGLNGPANLAIDGNNNLFVANSTANGIMEYATTPTSTTTNATLVSESGGYVPTTLSTNTSTLYSPQYIAIDKSGAVWTFSTGNGSSHPSNLVQILGVAAPTDPILADGKYGVKP